MRWRGRPSFRELSRIRVGTALNQRMAAVYGNIEGEVFSQYHDRVLPKGNSGERQGDTENKCEPPLSPDGGLRRMEGQQEIGIDTGPPEDDDEHERASIMDRGGIGGTLGPGSGDFQRDPDHECAPKNEGVDRSRGKWQGAQRQTSCVLYKIGG